MQPDNMDPSRDAEAAIEGAETDMDLAQELEQLRGLLEQAEVERDQMRDRQLREHAELDNQRRRMQRELERARSFANEKLLRDLLPVCDSLDRGLAVEHADAGDFKQGMQLTQKSLLKVMQGNGLELLDPVGKTFDPDFHEAMTMVEPEDGQAPNTVVTVLEKGYVLNGRLLRPARVIVTRT